MTRRRRFRLATMRPILRAYPFDRGRWRLASVLLASRLDGWRALDAEVAPLTPATTVRCRPGIDVPVHADSAFLGPYLFGTYEPASTALFRRLVRSGDTVVDTGANFGWYSALFGRWVGPEGRVIAFEPLPNIAELAAATIALNDRHGTVRLEACGLGAEEGEIVVHTFTGLPLGHASTSDLGRGDAVRHVCPVTTLDRYLAANGIERLDFLKIDVEGFEREVLQGASQTLSEESAPLVHFEVNRTCLAHRGIEPEELFQVLRDYGYREFVMVRPHGGVELVSMPRPGDADYVASKPAGESRFAALPGYTARRDRGPSL